MNGGGSYLHSGGSFSGPHQAQGEGRCSVLGITCGMRLGILKQGISAALACRVKKKSKNGHISHALPDPAIEHSQAKYCGVHNLFLVHNCMYSIPTVQFYYVFIGRTVFMYTTVGS